MRAPNGGRGVAREEIWGIFISVPEHKWCCFLPHSLSLFTLYNYLILSLFVALSSSLLFLSLSQYDDEEEKEGGWGVGAFNTVTCADVIRVLGRDNQASFITIGTTHTHSHTHVHTHTHAHPPTHTHTYTHI